jgi:trehalose 6-phosphate phosphatase
MTAPDLRALVAEPAGLLVALDFDGTLSPIVDDPDAARAHPAVPPVLRRLSAVVGHLAVVTGRPAEIAATRSGLVDIVAAAKAAGRPLPPNQLVVLGHYGAERWDGASAEVVGMPEHEGVAQARAVVAGWLDDGSLPAGASMEDKSRSIAVHTRRAADPTAAFTAALGLLDPLARGLGLTVEPGRFVVELRPPGVDKGAALRELVELVGACAVVYAGDDLGDLPAFAEVARLRASGLPGLTLCAASAEVSEVAEQADVVVDGPVGVAGWLTDLAAAAEQGS